MTPRGIPAATSNVSCFSGDSAKPASWTTTPASETLGTPSS